MIQQTSLDQTGIAIFKLNTTNEEKYVPLFSLTPCEEASELTRYIDGELKHVFITNNLCDYKIEDEIRDYAKSHNGAISEDLLDQLALGVPFVQGYESHFMMMLYS